jgi:hypothetical protein
VGMRNGTGGCLGDVAPESTRVGRSRSKGPEDVSVPFIGAGQRHSPWGTSESCCRRRLSTGGGGGGGGMACLSISSTSGLGGFGRV